MKIKIHDRAYISYTIEDNKENIDIDPIKLKLFHNDEFNESLVILKSPIRESIIPAILILEGNKTFGKKKKFLYKCIPDNKCYPVFLVPYDIDIGFNKCNKNKYVLIRFYEWSNDHPIGTITESIGDVNNIKSFYEYKLYVKSLHLSIKEITQKTNIIVKKNTNIIQEIKEKSIFINQNSHEKQPYIFSIDPENSVDFDDAISIVNNCVTVYLANVFMMLEYLQLWNSLSDKVSTIYLPDRKRPMLPPILSDNLCSLIENQERLAFSISFYFDQNNNQINEMTEIKNVTINVDKNYSYDNVSTDKNYKLLFDLTKKLDDNVSDSHEVIAFWMIYTNKYCADYMIPHKNGIFRTNIEYILYNDNVSLKHGVMGIDSYIHITSPIRRLVDLINQAIIFKNLYPNLLSYQAIDFINKWTNRLEFINYSMKTSKKIQNECFMVHSCFTYPNIMNESHEGVISEKEELSDNRFSYMVYLQNLKLYYRIKCNIDVSNNSKHKFDLFLFHKEEHTKEKIKLRFSF
jgi:exoribonuclease R